MHRLSLFPYEAKHIISFVFQNILISISLQTGCEYPTTCISSSLVVYLTTLSVTQIMASNNCEQ
jgi:hypothetical protein